VRLLAGLGVDTPHRTAVPFPGAALGILLDGFPVVVVALVLREEEDVLMATGGAVLVRSRAWRWACAR
jgi:hypothetical protein